MEHIKFGVFIEIKRDRLTHNKKTHLSIICIKIQIKMNGKNYKVNK